MSKKRLASLKANFLYDFDCNARKHPADFIFHNFCICACLSPVEKCELRNYLSSEGIL